MVPLTITSGGVTSPDSLRKTLSVQWTTNKCSSSQNPKILQTAQVGTLDLKVAKVDRHTLSFSQILNNGVSNDKFGIPCEDSSELVINLFL